MRSIPHLIFRELNFIFPVALMFLITGGFYTWGIKGSYNTEVHAIALEKPLAPDQGELKALVEQQLQILSIAVPSGGAKIKKGGTSFKLEWTGSARDVVLEPTSDSLSAKLTVSETTWYRHLVQLHKAKGGQFVAHCRLASTESEQLDRLVAKAAEVHQGLEIVHAELGVIGDDEAWLVSTELGV